MKTDCILFKGLSGDKLPEALAFFNAVEREFKKGEQVKKTTDPMTFFGMVIEGTVQIYSDDIDGNHMIMATVEPGETFGESLCYLKKNAPIYIEATRDTRLLMMNCDNVHADGNNPLSKRFVAMLAERTLSMNNRIQTLSKLSIRDKILTFFSQTVKAEKGKPFEIMMNREDMATYLGVNRSALSRELSNLKKEGILEYYHSVFKILK
ncbi:MAG: Crp/Fnr family transcriptional regulator [Eubacteriales bacterium]|nr:Crp/Fnr family transcriptional regulator [Eubacteriales bacterium]